MEGWGKVTGQKGKPRTKKSNQLATGRGFTKIRKVETYDSKSQKWREQITCDEEGQTVVTWLL